MREICKRCGMVANVDPSLHHERYAHLPVVLRDGTFYEFSYHTYTFSRKIDADDI